MHAATMLHELNLQCIVQCTAQSKLPCRCRRHSVTAQFTRCSVTGKKMLKMQCDWEKGALMQCDWE